MIQVKSSQMYSTRSHSSMISSHYEVTKYDSIPNQLFCKNNTLNNCKIKLEIYNYFAETRGNTFATETKYKDDTICSAKL